LLKKYYLDYKVSQEYYGTVPATFIEGDYFIGFNEEMGKKIEKCLLDKGANKCETGVGDTTFVGLEGQVSLPFLGKIDFKKYSLPALTVLLGLLDGFNVCSLGALVLILGLVLGLKSKKMTFLFGTIFILTTALVYGILIFVWYNVFYLFMSFMNIMEILIGLLGVGGGVYFFREFLRFKKYGPTCEASTSKGLIARFTSQFKERIKGSVSIILLAGSVLFFAAILTILEFPCSAVVPVAFAGILAKSGLSFLSYLFYMAVYLFFYMLDEIIVFLVAFFTAKIWLASGKAVVWSALAESIILFILGIYYLYASVVGYFG